MHRALEREGLAEDRHPGNYVLHRENATERIIGRVLDKGLGGDEMGERVRLVVDGVDGPHRDGRRPRRGRRPMHDRRGRLRPS
jgi:hypothetical protein